MYRLKFDLDYKDLWKNMKVTVRKLLHKFGMQQSIKSSHIYDIYSFLWLHNHWERVQKQKKFLERLIGSEAIIFDVGANGGAKADIYRRIAQKVICIEPDRQCTEILNSRFKDRENVVLLSKAISSEPGIGKFYIESSGSCVNTLSEKWKDSLERNKPEWWNGSEEIKFSVAYDIDITSLDQLIKEYGQPDYIKLDVEGFELPALQGLSQPVKLVSFEANLPIFLEETLQCLAILNDLSPSYKYAYSLEEGIGEGASRWLTYEEINDFVTSFDAHFLEIAAYSSSS